MSLGSPLLTNERTPLLAGSLAENGLNDNRVADNASLVARTSEPPQYVYDKPTSSLAPVFVPMAIGVFLAAMDGSIVVSSSAAIGSELKQLQNASWVATGYMLSMTSFQPLYGKFSDIFGRKACLLFAYTVFATGCLLCGFSRNMSQLIAARAIAGVGGAGMTTLVSIIMSDIVPLRSRGTWQGIINIVFQSGSAIGAPLGGYLADNFGWRWAFIVQVPITLLAIIFVSISLHLPHHDGSDLRAKLKRIDVGGSIALVATVFFLLFGLDRGGNLSWGDNLTMSSLIACVISLIIFLIIETKIAPEPLAPQRIITKNSLFVTYLSNFFPMASGMSMLFHVSLYFQAVEGKNAAQSGLLLLPDAAGSLTGSLLGGLLVQLSGTYYLLTVAGFIVLVAGRVVATLMTGVIFRSALGVGVGILVAAIGNGVSITTSLVALIANAGPADQAAATAASYLFRSLGIVVGLSVASSLVQVTLRKELRRHLEGHDIDEIVRQVRRSLDYIDQLNPSMRTVVRDSYEKAIHVTLWFSVSMTVCAAVCSLFIKVKPLIKHS
ncbi:MFS general substrate transporter [Lentinula edodes]|uniref:MFS general substrate transporter n=1 Tax=Lentinula edodes TaxID=5353 RepID=UPI001E8DC9F3|nr:MFS general substrate transporter [Lentinula edodes]KAH7871339.1 MFS general substrate transporter [Lentinula edodes]